MDELQNTFDAPSQANESVIVNPIEETGQTTLGTSPQAQKSARRGMRLLKRFVGLVVVAVILVLLGIDIAQSWNTLANYHWQVSVPLLVLAFAGFVAQTLSYPLIWRSILRRLGQRLSLPKSVRIYLASEFVRYIPGNVWHVLTRILWVEREGVPKSIGFISMMVELVTKIAGAALIFAVTLLFWPHIEAVGQVFGGHSALLIGIVGIVALLALLQPRLLNWCLARGLKLLRKPPITVPLRYRDVLAVTLWWCVSWMIGGLAFYLLFLGIAGTGAAGGIGPALLTLALCIGIYALGWDIGFLSFITPSGLGFREAAIILLLGLAAVTPTVALATVIAFLSRILTTLAELLCVSGAHIIVTRLGRSADKSTKAAEEQPVVNALTD
ncbi:MAG TPA: lysylphosphatidylglycerol synthase transmembrane domain-containing protein [Ktedonobacterales bacterium]|nr:lysylphosphatidylglycerol synthase transmembrane domain-containing protein [Ktedonobacterales bacterium]